METNIYEKIKSDGFNSSHIYVKNAGKNKYGKEKGLGVFAKNKITKNNIIEYCPSIVLDWKEKFIHDKSLKQYSYWHKCDCSECKKYGATALIPLGYGSIINSADIEENQNCRWTTHPQLKLVIFFAIKDIEKDEEILTWWGNDYFNNWCK